MNGVRILNGTTAAAWRKRCGHKKTKHKKKKNGQAPRGKGTRPGGPDGDQKKNGAHARRRSAGREGVPSRLPQPRMHYRKIDRAPVRNGGRHGKNDSSRKPPKSQGRRHSKNDNARLMAKRPPARPCMSSQHVRPAGQRHSRGKSPTPATERRAKRRQASPWATADHTGPVLVGERPRPTNASREASYPGISLATKADSRGRNPRSPPQDGSRRSCRGKFWKAHARTGQGAGKHEEDQAEG